MTDGRRYVRADSLKLFRSASGPTVAAVGQPARWETLTMELWRALGACDGCSSIEFHISRVGRVLTEASAGRAVHDLIARQLLVPCVDDQSAGNGDAAIAGHIAAIAIVTRNRPAQLSGALASLAEHLRRCDRQPTVVVVDASDATDDQRAAQAALMDVHASCGAPTQYVGVEHAHATRQRLQKRGWPSKLLEFGLTLGSRGANRNLALLLTYGQDVLFLDDDVTADTWTANQTVHTVRWSLDRDPRKSEFFSSRAAALHTRRFHAVDLLEAHEGLLGRQVLMSAGHSGSECRHFPVDSHVVSKAATVRWTQAGLVGDSAMRCPYRFHFGDGPTVALLKGSPGSYATAMRSREVARWTDANLITRTGACMAYCLGFVNQGVTCPFFPHGRNEDGLMGFLLHTCDPHAYTGYIPVGVVHNSHRAATYADGIWSASQNHIESYIMALTDRWQKSVVTSEPNARVKALGRYLLESTAITDSAFAELLRDVVVLMRGRELAELARVAASSESPAHWRAGACEYRDALLTAMNAESFYWPYEFSTAERPVRAAREAIGAFGELLLAWSDLVRAVREDHELSA